MTPSGLRRRLFAPDHLRADPVPHLLAERLQRLGGADHDLEFDHFTGFVAPGSAIARRASETRYVLPKGAAARFRRPKRSHASPAASFAAGPQGCLCPQGPPPSVYSPGDFESTDRAHDAG